MDKPSTSAASDGGIPPPIMTIKLPLGTPNKNVKKRELEDDSEMRLEDFLREFEIGEDVWVISKGQWHKAKVILTEESQYPVDNVTAVPCYKIHYPGWGKRYDEWMFSDSLMLQNLENDEKAGAENAAFLASSGMKKKTGKKSGQKEKATADTAERKTSLQDIPSPSPFDGVSSTRGRGRGGGRGAGRGAGRGSGRGGGRGSGRGSGRGYGRGGATAKPRGATNSKRARFDARQSGGDRLLAPESLSLEPFSLASALESESAASTDKAVNGRVPHSVSASSSTGSLAESGIKEESVEPAETKAQTKDKALRAAEEFNALVEHYEACEVDNPDLETTDEQLMILDILSAVGIAPETDMEPRSAVEKRKQCLDALHKLSYLTVARMRKLLDQTIFKVALPQGVKRLMADNYIQTVWNAKVLKSAEPAYSAKTVVEQYRAFAQTVPEGKSIFWNKARLAEINILESILTGSVISPSPLAHRFMMRLEWPMLAEWKKDKIKMDPLQRFGVVHVVRVVQLMTYFYNSECKKLVGNPSKQLLAIYEDLLRFIDETFVPGLLENTDVLYQHMDNTYLERVKYVGFEKVDDPDDPTYKEDMLHRFHHLSDSFFDELADKHIGHDMKDLTFVVEWKAVVSSDSDSSPVKDEAEPEAS